MNPMLKARTESRRVRMVAYAGLIGLVGALSLVSGCSKPPPPPPPPAPAPPPPPPPNIKLEDVGQEMHVDARVQVAPGMEVGPEDRDLASAVLKLADAVAKGDSAEIQPLLTRGAQSILDTLKANGGWESGTSKIEAVRIVAVQPGVNFSSASAAPAPSAAVGGVVSTMLENLPQEQRKAVQEAMGKLSDDPSALQANVDAAIAKMKEMGMSDQLIAQMQEGKKHLEEAAKVMASTPPAENLVGTGILLAVQDPGGAYLMGWQADKIDGHWVFSSAPSNGDERPRASAFDGIGEAGFSMGQLAANDSADDATAAPSDHKPQADEPSSPNAPAPAQPSAPGPRKKSTPAGPITIPGG